LGADVDINSVGHEWLDSEKEKRTAVNNDPLCWIAQGIIVFLLLSFLKVSQKSFYL